MTSITKYLEGGTTIEIDRAQAVTDAYRALAIMLTLGGEIRAATSHGLITFYKSDADSNGDVIRVGAGGEALEAHKGGAWLQIADMTIQQYAKGETMNDQQTSTTNAIIPVTAPSAAILLLDTDKSDVKSRLTAFAKWSAARGAAWYEPNLKAYRDHLQNERGLSPASALAHLSTIRGRYRMIAKADGTRPTLFEYAAAQGITGGADRKAFVDEIIKRLEDALDPINAPVEIVNKQEIPDSDHIRLTRPQSDALLRAPGTDTIQGLRDTAIIALMLCTGIREMELCALNCDDLDKTLGGAKALNIRKGKGAKSRVIPYGDLDWCLAIVKNWLSEAGITEGAVFRAFNKPRKGERPTIRAERRTRKGGKPRPPRLSVRAVQDILHRYPISIDGEARVVNPHDLRRTYARSLYDNGVLPIAIQNNLGHADLKTTLRYIGVLNADQRKPPSIYTPPPLHSLKAKRII